MSNISKVQKCNIEGLSLNIYFYEIKETSGFKMLYTLKQLFIAISDFKYKGKLKALFSL